MRSRFSSSCPGFDSQRFQIFISYHVAEIFQRPSTAQNNNRIVQKLNKVDKTRLVLLDSATKVRCSALTVRLTISFRVALKASKELSLEKEQNLAATGS